MCNASDAGVVGRLNVYLGDMHGLFAVVLLLGSAASGQASPFPSAEKPLPEPVALMRAVEAKQKAAELLVSNYTFHGKSVTERMDGKGRVKETETEERDFYTREGVGVSRVVRKDGRLLTPDEEKKEDERIEKEVQRAKERKAKAANKGKDTDSRGDETISLSRILELGSFSNERRVLSGGRETILLDYAGNKEGKSHSAAENVFRDVRGTIAIDEETEALVRMEGQFQTDFRVGGGLVASVSKGTHFSFNATRVNDEVWLPLDFQGEGSARFLLLIHLDGRIAVHFSDYRKFRGTATVLPGLKEVPE